MATCLIHSVEKDNSGVEGAHKTEEAAERGVKYGARKFKQGYRSHKLKPYREAAKAEKAAFQANVDFQYHKTLHDNPQLTSNPLSRFWQKQQIKRQYTKAAKQGGAKGIKAAAENTRKAAKKPQKKQSRQRRLWQDTRQALQSLLVRCFSLSSLCRGCPLAGQCFPTP